MWPQYRFRKLECFQNWEKALVNIEVGLALGWRCWAQQWEDNLGLGIYAGLRAWWDHLTWILDWTEKVRNVCGESWPPQPRPFSLFQALQLSSTLTFTHPPENCHLGKHLLNQQNCRADAGVPLLLATLGHLPLTVNSAFKLKEHFSNSRIPGAWDRSGNCGNFFFFPLWRYWREGGLSQPFRCHAT